MDDLLNDSLEAVIAAGEATRPSKGATLELYGCTFRLTNPRARLSRSSVRGLAFSPLGELAWYLSGSNDASFITHYISDYSKYAEADGRIHGGYGPRLFGSDRQAQIHNIVSGLRANRASRKAVAQVFESADLSQGYLDVPCTCTIQFLVREERLQMIVFMRSNDLFMGFPHDVFAFTMIQEIVARSLGIEVGTYTHMVGSLHLYAKDLGRAKLFLQEGFHDTLGVMPAMPGGDPWPAIKELLLAERAARSGAALSPSLDDLPYWKDLALLLQAYAVRDSVDGLEALRDQFSTDAYWTYLRARIDRLTVLRQQP
ncbi:thymidylate synthase [Modestobacter sp. L9-4]|uniref:thymidylate synthase n=1 Tax=Modestobacter sp. L9-4 TaxID=2851567 RepID=UPI001C76DFBF|nr:thymidylate synthase [Modestobacter sp. L9-4]QXG75287.1 thymidylate synthase [Modestobacter sp. L9-4]